MVSSIGSFLNSKIYFRNIVYDKNYLATYIVVEYYASLIFLLLIGAVSKYYEIVHNYQYMCIKFASYFTRISSVVIVVVVSFGTRVVFVMRPKSLARSATA